MVETWSSTQTWEGIGGNQCKLRLKIQNVHMRSWVRPTGTPTWTQHEHCPTAVATQVQSSDILKQFCSVSTPLYCLSSSSIVRERFTHNPCRYHQGYYIPRTLSLKGLLVCVYSSGGHSLTAVLQFLILTRSNTPFPPNASPCYRSVTYFGYLWISLMTESCALTTVAWPIQHHCNQHKGFWVCPAATKLKRKGADVSLSGYVHTWCYIAVTTCYGGIASAGTNCDTSGMSL